MIIIVIHIIRCLVKGDKIMKLKEHLVARELAEIEIRNMIKDFRKGRPILRYVFEEYEFEKEYE